MFNTNLSLIIKHKLSLNEKKYSMTLSSGEIAKYTSHSNETGITKENQHKMIENINHFQNDDTSLLIFTKFILILTQQTVDFVISRD